MRSQSWAIVVGVALVVGGCFDDPNLVTTTADEAGGSSETSAETETETETESAGRCGDGELNQPSEMCDGGLGCDDNCEFENYGCNPLNDAGCRPDSRCGLADFDLETFICMTPGTAGLGEFCGGGGYPNDGECAVGLTCTFNANTAYDCGGINCCVEYCDLNDPSFVCADGASCFPFFGDEGPMYQGLEHLGGCLFVG